MIEQFEYCPETGAFSRIIKEFDEALKERKEAELVAHIEKDTDKECSK